jgi:hypothetical protein
MGDKMGDRRIFGVEASVNAPRASRFEIQNMIKK